MHCISVQLFSVDPKPLLSLMSCIKAEQKDPLNMFQMRIQPAEKLKCDMQD